MSEPTSDNSVENANNKAESSNKKPKKPNKTSEQARPPEVTAPKTTAPKTTVSTTESVTPTPARAGGELSWLAILLSLAALGATVYTWYQNQVVSVQQESHLALGVKDIGSEVTRLGDTIARVQQDQANIVTQADLKTTALEFKALLNEQVQPLQTQQKDLGESLNKINGDLDKGVNQYLVDEVAQLLRLANNSVLFAGDTESAINALSLADNQLKSLKDPRYTRVRSKINEEIASLRTVQRPDIESISGKLRSMVALVPGFKLANEPPATDVEIAEVAEAEEVTWRTELKKVWRDMMSSVSVQRVDQPPKPLLAPEHRYFLNQNLQLSLSKAELALLQAESTVYQASLQDASTWLTEYFDLGDASVKKAIAQLAELAAETITTDIPEVTESYQALQDIRGGQQ